MIEGPAQDGRHSAMGEDLLSRLMTDTGTGEALPLLAFTLEQLAHGVKRAVSWNTSATRSGRCGACADPQAEAALQDACRQAGVGRDG